MWLRDYEITGVRRRWGDAVARAQKEPGPGAWGERHRSPARGKSRRRGECASGLGSYGRDLGRAERSGRAARSARPKLQRRIGLPCPEDLFPRSSPLKRRSSAMFARHSTPAHAGGNPAPRAPQARSPQPRATTRAACLPRQAEARTRAGRHRPARQAPRPGGLHRPAQRPPPAQHTPAAPLSAPPLSTHCPAQHARSRSTPPPPGRLPVRPSTGAARRSLITAPTEPHIADRASDHRRSLGPLTRAEHPATTGQSANPPQEWERHPATGADPPSPRRRSPTLTPPPRSPCRGPASSVPAGRASRSGGCVPASGRVPCRPRSGCAHGRRRCHTAS